MNPFVITDEKIYRFRLGATFRGRVFEMMEEGKVGKRKETRKQVEKKNEMGRK